MAWAATSEVVWGCIAFGVWWILSVFPALPVLPIGRTAGSLFGGTLMVVFQVLSPKAAFAAVDLDILGLLFGTMVVSVALQMAGMFRYLEYALSWRTRGGIDLLCRLCVVSGLSSALFTNDTTCVFLTRFVLELCRQKKLRPLPFLLALACSANIGSSATPIGNPQNLVIAVTSGISFGSFLSGVLPAMAIGLAVNALLLAVVYGRSLSLESSPNQQSAPAPNQQSAPAPNQQSAPSPNQQSAPSPNRQSAISEPVDVEIPRSRRSRRENLPNGDIENGGALERGEPRGAAMLRRRLKLLGNSWAKYKKKMWIVSVYLVTLGMLVAFLLGLDLTWTAITAAVAVMVLSFADAGPILEKVSYNLLVFFSGMFIATSGFNATGAPEAFWSAVEPHSRINTASGISVLSLVVIVLSNVVSNVPTVILLGPKVAGSAATAGASADKAWLILAWVSTVAGNLTLVGSAANIIVSEEARETQAEKELREGQSNDLAGRLEAPGRATYNMTFWNHLKFGFPSTLIVTAVGLFLIAFRKF